MGESPEQNDIRPYISGDFYMGTGKVWKNASLTILNPTSETKLSAIYAGDYWLDREMDVELNIAGTLLDTTIHAGGDDALLKGTVNVNLIGSSSVTDFDQQNHDGDLNLTLQKGVFTASLSVEGVANLELMEGARITVTDGGNIRAGRW